jgi:glutathione S-transferase
MDTLIGSLTSPYVRRIRLYLRGVDYKLETVNYLDGQDDARLSAINPIKRIPVLVVDGKPLWESRVIYGYLQRTLGKPTLSFEEENAISAIDALQDALIQPFLMKRMGHPVDRNTAYFQRHAERQRLILDYLAAEHERGRFERWDYPAMSLYSLLDWSLFRECMRTDELPKPLLRFYEKTRTQPLIAETDPRKA